MARTGSEDHYVTNKELAAELRATRWEMRFLIALAALANVGVGYQLKVPGVADAVAAVLHLF